MEAMDRRKFILTACSAALVPALAQADEMQDAIVRELGAQGYTHVKISRTWLGRLRFVATSETREREIIVNGRTGEILRDYWHDLSTESAPIPRIVDPDHSSPFGNGSSSSGSGSSSSGSGGGSTPEQQDGGSSGSDNHSGDSSSSEHDSGSDDSDSHDSGHDGGDDSSSDNRESDD
jgi:hypothetical protein